MPHYLKITTALSPQEIKAITGDLHRILTNKSTRYNNLRKYFWAVFTQEMFRRLRRSYMARSWRRADELGSRWQPIKQSTVKRKQKTHYRGSRKLPPSRFPTSYNRDTSELIDSYSPGKITSSEYIPVPNQHVSLRNGVLEMGSLIEYAEHAFRDRPLLPHNWSVWVRESLSIAVRKTMPLLGKS